MVSTAGRLCVSRLVCTLCSWYRADKVVCDAVKLYITLLVIGILGITQLLLSDISFNNHYSSDRDRAVVDTGTISLAISPSLSLFLERNFLS